MQQHMFPGTGMVRVFPSWDARRGTFTAYAKDIHDTIVWQVGQQADLVTIEDLRLALRAHRAFLTVEVAAALLGDQESGPAVPLADADRMVGVAQ
ncbi:hypothetical protein AB0K21_21785 [Streptosporangium sp. NPDC049248]|uniref:hypothetical protein n=1 Tax=Streptosporangium sp. NPDC049248 TaxID=3155651 RepID=UPI00344A4942